MARTTPVTPHKPAPSRPANLLTQLRRPFPAGALRLQVNAPRSGEFPLQVSLDAATVTARLDTVDRGWSMRTEVSPILGGTVDCHLTVGGITRSGAVTVNKLHPSPTEDPLDHALGCALVSAAARFGVGEYLVQLPAVSAIAVRVGQRSVILASEVARVRATIREWLAGAAATWGAPLGADPGPAVPLTAAGLDAGPVLVRDPALAEAVEAAQELLSQMEAAAGAAELLGLAPLIGEHSESVKDALRERFRTLQGRAGPVVVTDRHDAAPPEMTVVSAPLVVPPPFSSHGTIVTVARDFMRRISACETLAGLDEIEQAIEQAADRVTLRSLVIGTLTARRHQLGTSAAA
jgi:hypothetical protein